MNLGMLFSGGKDSALALHEAMKKNDIACLISVISENRYSYMFHTPNITLTQLQAQSIGIPLIHYSSQGEKEKELQDLARALQEAIDRYDVEGIVTGAIQSVYQATRIQKLCHELDLWCFNPLWLKNQHTLLYELIETGFEVIISGVYAYPFTREWLGRMLDRTTIKELVQLQRKYGISPSGEGGEIETTVLDAPYFNQKIQVLSSQTEFNKYTGQYIITDACLVDK